MHRMLRVPLLASAALMSFVASAAAQQGPQPNANMSFFVTSKPVGKGGDLGGIAGADAHCQMLAQSVGAGGKTWHAYLSSNTDMTKPNETVNARDRIGKGPWANFKGVTIATSVDDLHSNNNKITIDTGLTERGQKVPGVGYTTVQHDIVTGSMPDGRAFPGNQNMTCGSAKGSYTSSEFGKVEVGHVDRTGLADTAQAHSWNSSHQSRGCTQDDLIATGGNGYLYCFAVQ